MILPSKPEDIEKINEQEDELENLRGNIALRDKLIVEQSNKIDQSSKEKKDTQD